MSKDKAILPISYFGPIAYYQLLYSHDCTIEQHENYQKRTIRNRTEILSANGVLVLSVPLCKGKTQSLITHTQISYAEPWAAHHLKSIRSAYSSAPYFDHYFESISAVINQKYKTLFHLDQATLAFIKEQGLIGDYELSTHYVHRYASNISDYRSEKGWINRDSTPYIQVFESKFGFISSLSILDALFNLGPEASKVIQAG